MFMLFGRNNLRSVMNKMNNIIFLKFSVVTFVLFLIPFALLADTTLSEMSDFKQLLKSHQINNLPSPSVVTQNVGRVYIDKTFDKIETLLGRDGAYLDAIYYCPHHPDSGFKGEVKRLKKVCSCRKPNIGLIEKAVKDFNLDLSKCFIIGDSNVDVQTGINAKIPQVKVNSTLVEKTEIEPTYHAQTFLEAVEKIMEN